MKPGGESDDAATPTDPRQNNSATTPADGAPTYGTPTDGAATDGAPTDGAAEAPLSSPADGELDASPPDGSGDSDDSVAAGAEPTGRGWKHKALIFVLLASAILLSGILLDGTLDQLELGTVGSTDATKDEAAQLGRPWYGLCNPYAASSVEEFRFQVLSDPVLRRHYVNFDWHRAYMYEALEDRWLSVTYRTPNAIAWTRKRIKIRKGEHIISDGKIEVRTFCCNQIAKIPLGRTHVQEPEAIDLQPYVPVAVQPPPQPMLVPGPIRITRPVDIVRFPIGQRPIYPNPIFPNPNNPNTNNPNLISPPGVEPPAVEAVPEPATLITTLAGLSILGLARRRKRGRASTTESAPSDRRG